MYRALTSIIYSALFALPLAVHAGAELVMAEEPGCMWCARWNEEIAPIYPKTEEGAAAPLRRIDITNSIPDDVVLDRRITYTPTFVLLVDGKEVRRLEGYPGEDFFWGLLGMMLKEADVPFETKANTVATD